MCVIVCLFVLWCLCVFLALVWLFASLFGVDAVGVVVAVVHLVVADV